MHALAIRIMYINFVKFNTRQLCQNLSFFLVPLMYTLNFGNEDPFFKQINYTEHLSNTCYFHEILSTTTMSKINFKVLPSIRCVLRYFYVFLYTLYLINVYHFLQKTSFEHPSYVYKFH